MRKNVTVGTISAATLLMLSHLMAPASKAQAPAPTPARPSIALLPDFQPGVYQMGDTTTLTRIEFVPDSTQFPGRRPIAIIIHPGGFHGGSYGAADMNPVYHDFVAAGFLTFGIDYRLAPPGKITGQVPHYMDPTGASGRPPEQTDDIKQQVLSARNDLRGNGTVVTVGGSAGGSHAVWVAMDGAENEVPTWNSSKLANAAASLSGPYDYGSRVGDPDLVAAFVDAITNYTKTKDTDTATQHMLSPIVLVSSLSKPMILIDSEHDGQPPAQRTTMTSALNTAGVTNKSFTVMGSSGHAFEYWTTTDPNDPLGRTVGKEVMDFLIANILPF